jgi:hypothetical protein
MDGELSAKSRTLYALDFVWHKIYYCERNTRRPAQGLSMRVIFGQLAKTEEAGLERGCAIVDKDRGVG